MNKPPIAPYRPPPAEPGPPPILARTVNESPDELQLRPPDCPSREEFLHEIDPEIPVEPETPTPARPFQFSLVDVMVVTAGVAVGLAGGTWMPPGEFAMCLGVATLAWLIWIHFYPPESHVGWLAWGTMILAYFTAVFAALFRSPPP